MSGEILSIDEIRDKSGAVTAYVAVARKFIPVENRYKVNVAQPVLPQDATPEQHAQALAQAVETARGEAAAQAQAWIAAEGV